MKNRDRQSQIILALAMVSLISSGCAVRPPPPPPPEVVVPPPEPERTGETFAAPAYSVGGTTASGKQTRRGIIAADPKILPLGSRVRVEGAGAYDGEYLVADTGRAINGREIDLYLPSTAEAKRFGRKKVRVVVLRKGDGRVSER